jgi:chromosome segregation ATPase
MKRKIWKATLLAGSLGAALATGSLHAQETKSLSDTVSKTVATQQDTQKKQEAWAEEKNDLTARYRAAKAQVDYLEKTKAFEQNEVASLDKGIAELERRMVESGRLKDNLEDSLNVVMGHLDTWVNHDIPFLMDERHARLASVREAIAKPEVSAAEKLRRVLEALQVEANYGNTVDVSQERIQVGSEEVSADVIRVGRVSVFWRSPDGKRVGEYDRASKQWVEIDRKYAQDIGNVREMVLRLRSTKVITLPLGRIEP